MGSDDLHSRDLLVLYGSQTGTAEEVSEGLVRDAIRRHFNVHMSALNDFNLSTLPACRLVIFVCSTTGQGDPPDNMRTFWKFLLRRNLSRDSLNQMSYAVIGLGDSSYQKYNFVAKKLHRRLAQLSGTSLVPLILCDDQHDLGLDHGLDTNVPKLWQAVLNQYPLPANRTIIPGSEILPPKVRILVRSSPDIHQSEQENRLSSADSTETSSASPYPARLMSNDRITEANHFQDVRLIRLDVAGSNIRYYPGDVAYIQPQNSAENVNKFLSLLNLDPDQQISIEPYYKSNDHQINKRLAAVQTWRQLATDYLDLNTVPRRYFFELMAHFSKDELEKEKLEEFSSPEGQDERFAYCNRVHRNIVEVLSEFRHTTPNIPLNYILDLIPVLQPRAFSIASAQTTDENIIELLVAVVNYKTKISEPRLGVCSNWLANLTPHSSQNSTGDDISHSDEIIPMWTQTGTMNFPDQGEPCIMIGPGTGVAPFRSFIQHRISQGYHENLLAFGCRHRDADFLCADEWREYTSSSKLTLLTAFSRDQEEKYYVWNSLLDNSDLIWKWIHHHKAYIFIAGNAKRMPDDVRAALITIIESNLPPDNGVVSSGEDYLLNLEKSGRYQLECWS